MYKPLRIFFAFIFIFLVKNLSAQQFEMNMRKAYTLLTIAQERDRSAAEKLEDIKTKRIRLEEDLIDSQDNGRSLSKKAKEALSNQIKLFKKQESEASKSRENAHVFLNQITDIIKAPEKKREKFIAEYEKKNGVLSDAKPNDATTSVEPIPASTEPSSETKTNDRMVSLENQTTIEEPKEDKKEDKSIKKEPKSKSSTKKKASKSEPNTPSVTIRQARKYDPKNDVLINPPTPNCVIAFDGVDKFTERKKRETYSQVIFTHTEDFMRPAMKDKDYITCEGAASRIQGGFYFLNLTFTIQTKEAQRAFGFLDKGTPIVFKLINGRTMTFTNSKTDIGTIDSNNGITTYKAQLQISGSDVKAFIDSELDVIRVAWSAGYEDYEIYDMDVLSNMFSCLEKENK